MAWLGNGPVSATPAAVKGELEKLAYLRRMDADTLNLSVLPAERRRFLAGLGRRLTAQNLARRDDDRRYPILLTLAAQSAVDVLDEVLLLFDQALSGGRWLRRDVGHERMLPAWEARRERLPRDHGHLAMMDASMAYLRQFVPDVLAAVKFADGPGMDDLLEAAGILAGLHARKARKVPDGARTASCPPGGPGTWRRRRRTATSRPTGTTRSCAC